MNHLKKKTENNIRKSVYISQGLYTFCIECNKKEKTINKNSICS